MKTAVFVCSLESGRNGHLVELFRCDPPLVGGWNDEVYEYVIASSVYVPEINRDETYLFGSNNAGVVRDWCELPGSQIGTRDIDRVWQEAGYNVVRIPPERTK